MKWRIIGCVGLFLTGFVAGTHALTLAGYGPEHIEPAAWKLVVDGLVASGFAVLAAGKYDPEAPHD